MVFAIVLAMACSFILGISTGQKGKNKAKVTHEDTIIGHGLGKKPLVDTSGGAYPQN